MTIGSHRSVSKRSSRADSWPGVTTSGRRLMPSGSSSGALITLLPKMVPRGQIVNPRDPAAPPDRAVRFAIFLDRMALSDRIDPEPAQGPDPTARPVRPAPEKESID